MGRNPKVDVDSRGEAQEDEERLLRFASLMTTGEDVAGLRRPLKQKASNLEPKIRSVPAA